VRIVSWNCNGGFRNKRDKICELGADILIVQECENPDQSSAKHYKSSASNYLWIGQSKNKGIGVFARKGLTLQKLDWDKSYSISFNNDLPDISWKTTDLKLFLPFQVNDYLFIAVWTKGSDNEVFSYIGQVWKFLKIHRSDLTHQKVIMIGDFNSNVIWDKQDRWWNHSDVVRELSALKIESLYHAFFNEQQGEETQPTFYMHRKEHKPYHIDYAFCSHEVLQNSSIQIGDAIDWAGLSDHMPLIIDIKEHQSLSTLG